MKTRQARIARIIITVFTIILLLSMILGILVNVR
jgi:uncharacterized membrane protein YtjA (UPF0391 family)